MYNRYIPNPQGGHTRIPQAEAMPNPPKLQPEREPPAKPQFSHEPPAPPLPVTPSPPPKSSSGGPSRITDSLTGFLRHGLDQLHLEHVDTGDLLLLGLLFFLFREDADEELLVALGLLLIL